MADQALDRGQYTEEPFASGPSVSADITLGIVCLICFIFGVPANLISAFFFVKTRLSRISGTSLQRFFGYLYIFITITDLMICFTIIPLIEAFFHHRKSVIFSNRILCATWAVLWEIAPFYSVFLVGVLSISRLLTLIYPHRSFNSRLLLISLVGYLVFLILSKTIPLILGWTQYIYLKNTMYCFLLEREPGYLPFSIASSTILLAAPIIPIMTSCLYTIYRLQKRNFIRAQSMKRSMSRQQEATKTIIIVTGVYISYNIPVFIKYIHHLVFVISSPLSEYKSHYHTTLLYYYSWVLTYVMCVVLNSTSNPVIYFLRMDTFRKFVIRRSTKETISLGERTVRRSTKEKDRMPKDKSFYDFDKQR